MDIRNGQITDNGRFVGTAMHELKHGYHPAILVLVNGHEKWFEVDTPDLLAKIADFARERDPGCMCCPDCTDGPDCPYCGEDYIQHLEKMEE